MITRVDSQLRQDIQNFALKYACEDCAHFETHARSCSLGFDPTVHLAHAISPGDTIVFCKTFELF